MNNLLKNLGPILILIGVIILAYYFFTESNSNTYLGVAGVIMIVGFLAHILLNKKIKD